jgi:hypothetical protein
MNNHKPPSHHMLHQMIRRKASILCFMFCMVSYSQNFGQQVPFAEVVPFVTTPQAVVDMMLEMANIQSNDVLYDLGSGDGRIPIAAARKYGIRAVGIEIDPDLVAEALRLAKEARVADKVSFQQGDLFKMDFSEASVLTLYLFPDINLQLLPRIMEMRPGTRIISHNYAIAGWEPQETRHWEGHEGRKHVLYLWTVPEKK